MLSAIPETIWSARKLIDARAWSAASATPARRPARTAPGRLPALPAATMLKNAPTSMQPSRAMFVTPDRSVMTPPSAASAIGVARRSIAARTPTPMRTSRFMSSCSCRQRLRRRAAALRDRAHDRLGRDDEEDRRLDDLDQVRRDARVRLHERAAARERGEEDAGERDADGRVLAEQRDGDRVEAEARREAVEHPVEEPAHLDHPRETRKAAGDEHHQHHAAPRVDARLRRGARAESDG